jgi:hypothetical protein
MTSLNVVYDSIHKRSNTLLDLLPSDVVKLLLSFLPMITRISYITTVVKDSCFYVTDQLDNKKLLVGRHYPTSLWNVLYRGRSLRIIIPCYVRIGNSKDAQGKIRYHFKFQKEWLALGSVINWDGHKPQFLTSNNMIITYTEPKHHILAFYSRTKHGPLFAEGI